MTKIASGSKLAGQLSAASLPIPYIYRKILKINLSGFPGGEILI